MASVETSKVKVAGAITAVIAVLAAFGIPVEDESVASIQEAAGVIIASGAILLTQGRAIVAKVKAAFSPDDE